MAPSKDFSMIQRPCIQPPLSYTVPQKYIISTKMVLTSAVHWSGTIIQFVFSFSLVVVVLVVVVSDVLAVVIVVIVFVVIIIIMITITITII